MSSDSEPEKYVPKEITNKKRTINKMRKNKDKRDKTKINKFPITGIYILTETLKKQNRIILEAIAEDFINSEEEREQFIQKYSKSNYYVPDISSTLEEEKSQKVLLKMM
jgi:hypothetical protein